MPACSPKKPRDPEFVALNKIVALLDALDDDVQVRVMQYLWGRFHQTPVARAEREYAKSLGASTPIRQETLVVNDPPHTQAVIRGLLPSD